MNPVEVIHGDGPVVLAMPHTGLFLPDDIGEALNEVGQALTDTDWNVDRLYEGLLPGATVVRATFHRYAIDPNRDPSGADLYPGQNTTGLCPLTDFDGRPLYRQGREPDPAEIERRRVAFSAPYHAALAAGLDRVRERHGIAVLYDCHSIRSEIPFLFEGRLPDFNIGSNNGTTCAPALEAAVHEICDRAEGYRTVLNGRFRGGWTTRHYGRPDAGIHAIQMELAQSTYMDEAPPWTWRADRADRVRAILGRVLDAVRQAARRLTGART